MKQKIYLFSFVVLVFSSAHSQPQFTQQMFNRMNINPAFAGLKNAAAPDTLDTKQLEIAGRSFTYSDAEYSLMATYQMSFGKKKKSGFGIMFNYNNERYQPFFLNEVGPAIVFHPVTLYNQYAGKLFYSYRIAQELYIGASGGIIDTYIPERKGWSDMGSPPTMPAQNFVTPDFDFGIAYNWRNLFFGISLGHLYQSHINGYYYSVPPNYTGLSVNIVSGANLNLWTTRLVFMWSIYNYNVAGTMLFYPVKYVFVGAALNIVNENPGADVLGSYYSYTSIMVGCDFFKSRLKISFSLDILPASYYNYYPKTMPNAESWMGYSFK